MSTLIVIPRARAIETILYHLSEKSGWQLELMGNGASSIAWRARHGNHDWIVRAMNIDSEKPITYPQELALLKCLHEAGYPVAEPIAHSEEADLPIVVFPWAVTSFVSGEPIKNGKMPLLAVQDLGRLFKFLHGIPAEAWGWAFYEDGRFIGKQNSAIAGAIERWQNHPLFPLDDTSLEAHPLSYNADFFIPAIKQIIPELIEAASYGQASICHTDLHGAHIFLSGDRLSALIDFGDACILPPAWDFAIMGHYYGWDAVAEALKIYQAEEGFLRQALALGVIVALQKFNRQYRRQATVLQRAMTLRFLQNSLEHFNGRPLL